MCAGAPSYTREVFVCMGVGGMLLHPGELETWAAAQRTQTSTGRREGQQPSGQGSNTLEQNPSTPTAGRSLPSSSLLASFRQSDPREHPRREEQNNTQTLSIGASREEALEQEWPVRPLPDGTVGPRTRDRVWSWVTRSTLCALTIKG